MNSCIYVIATPIGNLEDFSPRAKRILAEADLIAAEDTRRSRQLLSHFGISGKELVSYYDEVEQVRAAHLIERLQSEDLSLALISDAGTPCISDPGYRLLKLAHCSAIPVHPVPGASSFTALVSVSGLPSDRLLFVGFLPSKKKACIDEVKSWSSGAKSVVFYVAMRRLEKSLSWIREVHPQAMVCVGRELTKMHEEVFTCSIDEAVEVVSQKEVLKGEATVMVHFSADDRPLDLAGLSAMIAQDLDKGATFKDLWKAYASLGVGRSELYQMMLEHKRSKEEWEDESVE